MRTSVLEFGRFRLNAMARRLEKDGVPLRVSAPAFDILMALIERQGDVVSNDELLRMVWPHTEVDKVSVRVHMSGLRKALGKERPDDRVIVNVSGKGYRFVAPVRRLPQGELSRPGFPRRSAPPVLVRVVGRDMFIDVASTALAHSRFQTIVGPPGVGKTTVALAIAAAVETAFEAGTFFVDLAQIDKGAHVPKALTSDVGVAIFSEDPVADLSAYFSNRTALLILDNCEHLVAVVADICERLLDSAPGLTILATSREPLHADGEQIRILEPLGSPAADERIQLRQALRYPAVELFAQTARATSQDFVPTEDNIALIVDICRKLDGIPLAIEFAASRAGEFGLEGLIQRIDSRFMLLQHGRRTAPPRHMTLTHTLDWSYELLAPEEARALRKLSVFLGSFPIESAEAVVDKEPASLVSVGALLRSLVSKSLVSTTEASGAVRYRMLEMTREYARTRLMQKGELETAELDHARHALDILKQAEARWGDGLSSGWVQTYGYRVQNVRRAIAWAMTSERHVPLAVELIAHSSVLFTSLGLVDEHRVDLERGIRANASLDQPSAVMDAVMYSALGNVLYQIEGHLGGRASREAFRLGAEASRRSGNLSLEVRALSGLSAAYLVDGRNLDAVALTGELLRAGGSADHAVHRTLAHSNFYAGMLGEAKRHLDATLFEAEGSKAIRDAGAQFDVRLVTARATLAAYLYVTGRPDSALAVVGDCLADPAIFNFPIPLCHLAASSCMIAFNVGGKEAASQLLQVLDDTASLYAMGMWKQWAVGYEALTVARDLRGEGREKQAVRALLTQGVNGSRAHYYSCLGEGFTEAWLVEKSLAEEPGWCYPELLRAKAEFDLARTGNGVAAADVLNKAIRLAREGGMLTWELRAAISLVKHGSAEQSRSNVKLLSNVMSRFSEGHDTKDYIEAKALTGRQGPASI